MRWAIDARKLSRSLGNRPVALLNDLEASAHGLSELTPRQLVHLSPGLKPRDGNVALISPGTGLGMAILVRDGGRFIVSASEGGHVDFAPRDAEEAALLEYVQRRHPRVSQERIVAGPGFSTIYDFLVDTGRDRVVPLAGDCFKEVDTALASVQQQLEKGVVPSAACYTKVGTIVTALAAVASGTEPVANRSTMRRLEDISGAKLFRRELWREATRTLVELRGGALPRFGGKRGPYATVTVRLDAR